MIVIFGRNVKTTEDYVVANIEVSSSSDFRNIKKITLCLTVMFNVFNSTDIFVDLQPVQRRTFRLPPDLVGKRYMGSGTGICRFDSQPIDSD